MAPAAIVCQVAPVALARVTPPSPTAMNWLPCQATQFRFLLVPLLTVLHTDPSVLVAMNPPSPTTTNSRPVAGDAGQPLAKAGRKRLPGDPVRAGVNRAVVANRHRQVCRHRHGFQPVGRIEVQE